MRYHGKVSGWKDEKGYGFITLSGQSAKVFVHINAFIDRERRPVDGDVITYDLAFDRNRRARAENIRFLSADSLLRRKAEQARPPFENTSGATSFGHLIVLLFASLLVAAYFLTSLPIIIPGIYLVVSIVTYLFYADDKAAAKKRTWRTPESILHWFSLIGGWPGALLAQKKFRHKSKKKEFQQVFWILVILNCCVFVWLCTNSGSLFLQSMWSIFFIS